MFLFSEAVQQFLNSIFLNKIIKPHTAGLKTKQPTNQTTCLSTPLPETVISQMNTKHQPKFKLDYL